MLCRSVRWLGASVIRHVPAGGRRLQYASVRTRTRATGLATPIAGGTDGGSVRDPEQLAVRTTDMRRGRGVRTRVRQIATSPGLDTTLPAPIRASHRRAAGDSGVASYPAAMPPAGPRPPLGLAPARAAIMRQMQDAPAAATRHAVVPRLVTALVAVKRDDAGAAEAKVVLKDDPRPFDLSRAGGAAQLVRQFVALGKAGGAERMPLRQQPAGRIGDDPSAIGVRAVGDEPGGLALAAQAHTLQRFR